MLRLFIFLFAAIYVPHCLAGVVNREAEFQVDKRIEEIVEELSKSIDSYLAETMPQLSEEQRNELRDSEFFAVSTYLKELLNHMKEHQHEQKLEPFPEKNLENQEEQGFNPGEYFDHINAHEQGHEIESDSLNEQKRNERDESGEEIGDPDKSDDEKSRDEKTDDEKNDEVNHDEENEQKDKNTKNEEKEDTTEEEKSSEQHQAKNDGNDNSKDKVDEEKALEDLELLMYSCIHSFADNHDNHFLEHYDPPSAHAV